ncbi:DUF2281 domain-containing protein [Roseivirga sp.]|uniref:type II toxin-antitoxin system VapB family antitoxin n=1 Tax=Roseivirga sp. TaxID=1964215 RepID=UPI003B523678
MKESEILFKYSTLPEKLKKEFESFLQKLASKAQKKPETPNKRPIGLAKGLIEISSDFDEPLEDFKDYMS